MSGMALPFPVPGLCPSLIRCNQGGGGSSSSGGGEGGGRSSSVSSRDAINVTYRWSQFEKLSKACLEQTSVMHECSSIDRHEAWAMAREERVLVCLSMQ